jgi:hypothetical protein
MDWGWTSGLETNQEQIVIALEWKKMFPQNLIIGWMIFTFDYLGKLKFIFEMNLGYELGYQVDIYGEKPRGQNSHASVPLRC